MIRRRVVVHGQVQGVYFRDTCQREVQARELSGWISNRPDGSVEAVFEGDASAVDEMLEWCCQGPEHATVTRVDVRHEQPLGESGFRIR